MDSEVAGISALVAADAAAFLSGVNPSMFTIRQFSTSKPGVDSAETAGDIRRGMVIGSALALTAAFGGSAVTRSWWPVAATVFTLLILCLSYEWALRNPRGTSGMAGL
jgi:hypothetical protein